VGEGGREISEACQKDVVGYIKAIIERRLVII